MACLLAAQNQGFDRFNLDGYLPVHQAVAHGLVLTPHGVTKFSRSKNLNWLDYATIS
jgi:hypothetical protein